MSWEWVLIPTVATAVLVRIDGIWIGPYWSFTELVSGLGGIDATFLYEVRRLRWGMLRRSAYAVAMTGVVSLLRPSTSLGEAVLLGAVLTGLLLWPVMFHGLPLGVARSDWLLLPAYLGAALFFIGSSALGWIGVSYARGQGEGDALAYIRDQVAESVFLSALGLIGLAFFWGARDRMARVVDDRRAAGFEE